MADLVKLKGSMQVNGVQSKPEQHPETPQCEMCRRKKEHYSCDVCKTILSTKRNMAKHVLEKCNGWNTQTFHKQVIWKPKLSKDSKYVCPNCKKSFRLQSSLLNHMSVHESDKPFECEKCGKKFKRKGTLQTHKLIHTGKKPYKCETCKKQFRQQTSLNNHRLLHEEVKPHICQFCYRSFRQVGNLRQHVKKCHPMENLALHEGFVESQHKPETDKSLKLTFIVSGRKVDHQTTD